MFKYQLIVRELCPFLIRAGKSRVSADAVRHFNITIVGDRIFHFQSVICQGIRKLQFKVKWKAFFGNVICIKTEFSGIIRKLLCFENIIPRKSVLCDTVFSSVDKCFPAAKITYHREKQGRGFSPENRISAPHKLLAVQLQ